MEIRCFSYEQQLLTDQWQAKRKEALKADRYTCQVCFQKNKQLDVHHKKYIPGRLAWEYETRELITLCHDCHHTYHRQLNIIRNCYRLIQAL